MPRSPSRSRSRTRSRTRTRSPVKRARRRSETPTEPGNGCPFLIRLFITKGRHTPMSEFEGGRFPLQDEFQAYGWKHSTPSSLIQLLLPSFPAPYRSPLARYSFRHIYVDANPRGLYRTKDLVTFTGRDLMAVALPAEAEGVNGKGMDMELDDLPSRDTGASGKGGKIDEKTLKGYGFETGDLLSVSLYVPEPRGLRRPTAGGGGPPGNGNGPGTGASGDRGSFGWPNSGGGPAGPAGPDRTGAWERGAPLPAQSAARPTGRTSFGGAGGEPGAGGRWGRVGGAAGGQASVGIRGQARRSRSPDYAAGGRDDSRGERERRRSRSPEHRRESWASRMKERD